MEAEKVNVNAISLVKTSVSSSIKDTNVIFHISSDAREFENTLFRLNMLTAWVFILCLLSPVAFADGPAPTDDMVKKMEWFSLRAAPLGVLQNYSGAQSYSAMISWNPEVTFSKKWTVGFDFGYSIYKNSNQNRFKVLEYGLAGAYRIKGPWAIEAIAGGQTWIASGQKTGPMAGLNGKYIFPERLCGFIDQVFMGFGEVFQSVGFSIARVGIGAKF